MFGAAVPSLGNAAGFIDAFTRVTSSTAVPTDTGVEDMVRWFTAHRMHMVHQPLPVRLLLALACAPAPLMPGMWTILRAATFLVRVDMVNARSGAPGSTDGVRLAMRLTALNGVPYAHVGNISPTIWAYAQVHTGSTPEVMAFNGIIQWLRRGGRGSTAVITVRVMPVSVWTDVRTGRQGLRGYTHPELF